MRSFVFFFLAVLTLIALGCASCDPNNATPSPTPTPPPPEPTTVYPASCKEVQSEALADTGSLPEDGTYTLYVGGDQNSPWDAFCYQMNLENPLEYLSVSEADNYSQVGNGQTIAITSYRRYRIDPSTLEINPLDNTFATTEGFDSFTPDLPDDLDYIPAGWAQFQPTRSDDGPAAEAQANLAGTPFVFSESILANNLSDFFCQADSPDSDPADTSGTGAEVAADLSSFTLTAINSNQADLPTGVWTREVADCANLGPTATSITTASWPLQYVASTTSLQVPVH